MSSHQAAQWGEWTLGDLPDVVRTTAELLGPSATLARLTITPPRDAEALPCVQVVVDSEIALARLGHEVVEGEFVSLFERSSRRSWTCQVAGLRLHAAVGGGPQ